MSDENTFKPRYFDVRWDSNTYEKPWRDTSFLQCIYESDNAPTYQEMADVLECSVGVISKWMPEDARRGGEGISGERFALFSGGHDSLVSTHYTMENLDGDAVIHIDTGTGIDANQQFVEDVCDTHGWRLHIIKPDTSLHEFAVEWGFPSAAAHSWVYRYLKDHPLNKFVTELETDVPDFYTGVRKDESNRRMKTVSVEPSLSDNERWCWQSPIAEWTEEDIENYINKHSLPRNPVVENIGRSGECFCGAFGDRTEELKQLKEKYPEQFEFIVETEQRVQEEIGTNKEYCWWGNTSSCRHGNELMDEDEEVDMILCTDCEKNINN